MLLRRFWAFEAKLASLLVARLHAIVLLRQRIILGLGLLRRRFRFYHSFLGRQARLLPLFPALLNVRGELMQVVSHLLQRHGELEPMVGHAVVKAVQAVVALAVGTLAVFGAEGGILERARQLPQALGMLFFQARALLQKGGEILS